LTFILRKNTYSTPLPLQRIGKISEDVGEGPTLRRSLGEREMTYRFGSVISNSEKGYL